MAFKFNVTFIMALFLSGINSFAQMNSNDAKVASVLGLNLLKTAGVVTENHESCSREVLLVLVGNVKTYQISLAFGSAVSVVPVGKFQFSAPSPSSPGNPPAIPEKLTWQVSPAENYQLTVNQNGQIVKMVHVTAATALTCEFKIASSLGLHGM